MAHSYDFAVVKIVPDPLRDEALNAAIVVLRPGGLDVHVTPSPERLRAVAPAITPETLDDLASALKNFDESDEPTARRLENLRRLPGVIVSEPGAVQGENEAELCKNVVGLVSRLLTPVRLSFRQPFTKATALTRELTNYFKREKLLGRGEEDLNQHKIVRNVTLSDDGTIRADFVGRNSAFHVTETVDLRTPGELTTVRLKDIAVAALTLDEAKRKLGRKTQRYLVYAATAAEERRASGFLGVAEHHAEHVFNYTSRDDRTRYFDFMFAALRGDLASRARKDTGPKRRSKRRS